MTEIAGNESGTREPVIRQLTLADEDATISKANRMEVHRPNFKTLVSINLVISYQPYQTKYLE